MDGSVVPPHQVLKRRLRFRGLALPNEHGSWSVLLEPLVAGIAVAPSPAAPFIALLFVGGFLAHQPLRVCLTDLKNGRKMPHSSAAVILAAAFAAPTAIGFVGTWRITGFSSLVPLLAAAPLGLLQLGYDHAGKSRRLIPEVAGALALSSSAAIAAHAAGWSSTNALALWAMFAFRLIPSLLYVRSRLMLEKRKRASVAIPIGAHLVALAAVAVMAFGGHCTTLVLPLFAVLLARSVTGLSPWRRRLRAMQIGMLEVAYGTMTVAAVAAGHYLHI